MKKKIILNLLFMLSLSLISYSQVKDSLCLKAINDDVEQSTRIQSDEIDLGEFSVYVLAGKTRGTYPKLIFRVIKSDCMDESPIYFIFENEKRFVGRNYVFAFNCAGYSGQIVNNSTLNNLLKTVKLKTIRISSKSRNYDVELSEEQSNSLMQYINCANDFNSYKSLIKYKR